MPEHDLVIDTLRELADLDEPSLDLVAVQAAIETRLAEAERERTAWPRCATAPGRRRSRHALPLVTSVVVTLLVVAAVLLAVTRHDATTAVHPSGAPAPSTVSPATVPWGGASHPSHALLVREDAREHHHAPRRLLSAFAVFAHDRLPRTVHGATLSRPKLSSLPNSVLQTADPRRRNHIDVSEIRQVRLSTGAQVWILPGSRSLCLVASLPHSSPQNRGGNGGCAPIGPAIHRAAVGGGTAGTATWFAYGIMPRGHHLATVHVGPVRRPVHTAFGVYAIAVSRHH